MWTIIFVRQSFDVFVDVDRDEGDLEECFDLCCCLGNRCYCT